MMPRSLHRVAIATATLVAACTPSKDAVPEQQVAARDTAPQQTPRGSLPRIGVAVQDSVASWCAEFSADSTTPAVPNGTRVTLVFPGASAVASLAARVTGPHTGDCPTAFGQPRWFSYVAYRLELLDTPPADSANMPGVALVVATDAHWVRDTDGIVRADLDRDGVREEARRCAADEGEHFTLWSPRPEGGHVRRGHEYFDWGAFTEPTCKPGEDGQGGPVITPP